MNPAFTRLLSARLLTGLLLVALLPFAACKKADDLVLKTLNVKLEDDVELNVSSSPAPTSGLWSMDLDPDSNVDVRDNRSKIKEINIDKMAYLVNVYVSPTPHIKGSGDWKFYPTGSPSEAMVLTHLSDQDFDALNTSGAEQDMHISPAAKTKLIDLINNKKKITFVFEGGVSGQPVQVNFKVRVYTQIKVGV